MNYSVNADVLIRYFSGLSSPEEALYIDEWRKEDPDHELYFQELAVGWMAEQNYTAPDVEQLWKAFEHKTAAASVPLKRRPKRLKWLPYAAMLVVALGIGMWQYNQSGADKPLVFTYSADLNEFELKEDLLVTLKPEAVLQREIKGNDTLFSLSGNALFNFKQEYPGFRLKLTSGICLRDIGTEFFVESTKEAAKVSVYKGQVEVWDLKDTIKVNKHEVLSYTASGFSKTALLGDFDYKDYSLQQVCEHIGAYFHTELRTGNPALAGRTLTLRGKDLSFKQVLDIITETLDIKYNSGANDTIIFTSN